MTITELQQAFQRTYNQTATAIYFAPGRVNLIGEHTDYNGGHVLPCALSFGTYLLLAPNNSNQHHLCSLNVNGDDWKKYPLNVITELTKHGLNIPQGYNMLFWGNVPAGAGLSSSAAIEVVTAYAFNDILQHNLNRTDIARICQDAEHACGVNCGIMDQFASAQGKKDHAIYLNCQTLEFQHVPIQLNHIKLVIANTHAPHKLDSGTYNDRVQESQHALAIHDYNNPRARHFITEEQRTKDAIAALQHNDITSFGHLMNLSHISLRDDYEVTGPELDALAEAAWKTQGCLGSRMTGGGFGGCTISLVYDDEIEHFIQSVGQSYYNQTGLKADFYIAEIGDGAKKIL